MHEQDKHDDRLPEMVPGEYGHLLREIEKEPVPERLLELALKLQAALVEERRRQERGKAGPCPDGARR